MTSLQSLIDATAPHAPFDLGAQAWSVDEPLVLRRPIILHGKRSVAAIRPSSTFPPNEPTVRVLADQVTIDGPAIFGTAPNDTPYDPTFENQHAVRSEGAGHLTIRADFRNTHGDGVYLGKNGRGDDWSTDIALIDCTWYGIGRQCLTPAAARRVHVTGGLVGNHNRAVCDVEPPGTDWGCEDLLWTDTQIRGGENGYVFACKGVGHSGSVTRVTLARIGCHGRLFNVFVQPPAGTRRGAFTFTDCFSDIVAHSSPIRLWRTDGVTVRGVVQRCDNGAALIEQHDCTGVVTV